MAGGLLGEEGVSQVESVLGMRFWDASSWSLPQAASFVGVVMLSFVFLEWVVPLLFSGAPRIEARGKHHDKLDLKDVVCGRPENPYQKRAATKCAKLGRCVALFLPGELEATPVKSKIS